MDPTTSAHEFNDPRPCQDADSEAATTGVSSKKRETKAAGKVVDPQRFITKNLSLADSKVRN